MKTIIVPVDFSEHSEYALETAAILAQKNNAKIFVLHMLEMSEVLLTRSEGDFQLETIYFLKLAEKRFSTFLNKEYLKGISVTPIIKHFKVFREINEVVEEHHADLIVMGSHGASGIKELLVGSNTEKVVRYSNIPVLVVKHNPILTNFDDVVFACNFNEESVTPYIKAVKLFEALGSKLHLIHVNLPNEQFRSTAEIETKVVSFLKKAEGTMDRFKDVAFVSDYTIEQGILNYANVLGADLIALATHGRTGLAHFFEGSISEDLANHSALPVMTFKI